MFGVNRTPIEPHERAGANVRIKSFAGIESRQAASPQMKSGLREKPISTPWCW
jgi:hypothetical protein